VCIPGEAAVAHTVAVARGCSGTGTRAEASTLLLLSTRYPGTVDAQSIGNVDAVDCQCIHVRAVWTEARIMRKGQRARTRRHCLQVVLIIKEQTSKHSPWMYQIRFKL
jgi:hypothetical protein